jgi:site-specific DNA-methyltransferase (adenine-specific)
MQLVQLSDIVIRGDRQRKTIATGPLNELKDSILTVGLLAPPVCWFDAEVKKWVLVTGERRLRALTEISKTPGLTFHCENTTTGGGFIPITPLGDYLDEAGRFEAELDENIKREDLEWPDRIRAIAALHDMRLAQNPAQTVHDTAKELAQRSGTPPDRDGGARSTHKQITQAIVIAQHLHKTSIALARDPSEAIRLIYQKEEEKVLAALAKRKLAALPKDSLDIEIRNADLFQLLPVLDSATFDCLIADPPYGIDANSAGYRARAVHHHNYKDDADSAKALAQVILTEGFRVLRPRANIFIFCDIDLFPWLKATAQNMGWSVFRRPLIWVKSESEGMAPWGGQGPRITTEFIFYATKGQRGLNASPTDVLDFRRVSRDARTHAAEKPVELLKALVNCSTLPGDRVLDPCCGSGSTLVACRDLKRRAMGIELDPDYYNTAMANVFGKQP